MFVKKSCRAIPSTYFMSNALFCKAYGFRDDETKASEWPKLLRYTYSYFSELVYSTINNGLTSITEVIS
jgi:hypothetical protein